MSGNGSGHGVYGRSSNGAGVYGTGSYNGVEGHTSNTGDYGVAGFGAGSGSSSFSGNGVFGAGGGKGSSGVSGYAENGGRGVYAVAADGKTDIFYGWDAATNGTCVINHKANLKCSGTITGGKAVHVRHKNAAGEQVVAYAAESASAIIEDVGTARLDAGVANVQINPDFAATIDRGSAYYVFLTPQGDTRGLYVSIKTPSAFQVREAEHGRSTLWFDYRIAARPLDADHNRLPLAATMTMSP